MHLDTISPLHQHAVMRLTVNLDEDLYALAKTISKTEDCTISTAINRLIRRSLEPLGAPQSSNLGLPIVPCRITFTSDDVLRAEAEAAPGPTGE